MYGQQLTVNTTTTTTNLVDMDESKMLDNNRTDFSFASEGLMSIPDLGPLTSVPVHMMHHGLPAQNVHQPQQSCLKRKRGSELDGQPQEGGAKQDGGGYQGGDIREEKRAKLFYNHEPVGLHGGPSRLQQASSSMKSMQQFQQGPPIQFYPQGPQGQITQPALTQPLYGPTVNADVYRASQEAYISVVKKPSGGYPVMPQQRVQHVTTPGAHQVHHIQIQRVQQMHHQQVHPQTPHHLDTSSNFTVPPSIVNMVSDDDSSASQGIPDLSPRPKQGKKKLESGSNASTTSSSGKKAKKKEKKPGKVKTHSGEKVDITHLLKYPQSQAAQLLNMSQATFSKRFREANNKRWPYRRLIVLEKQLKTAISEGDRAAEEALQTATKQLLSGCFIYKK